MSTLINEPETIHIPSWVVNVETFRRWADQEEFPDSGRICYFQGGVWVDMSKEQIFSHLDVKDEYTRVVKGLVRKRKRGRYFSDGLLLTNEPAGISVVPDGTFISAESLDVGRVRLIDGAEEGFVEAEGSPDMVLEIVSRSSVHKDTVVLLQAYWEAGISEYWLVDARKEPFRFDIFGHGSKRYVPTRKQPGGWVKSPVLDASFRLTCQRDAGDRPEFTLEVR